MIPPLLFSDRLIDQQQQSWTIQESSVPQIDLEEEPDEVQEQFLVNCAYHQGIVDTTASNVHNQRKQRW